MHPLMIFLPFLMSMRYFLKIMIRTGIRTSKMYPRFMYAEEGRMQKFVAVLVTTKSGVTTATKIFEETKDPENMSTVGKEQTNAKLRIIFDVTEEMLSGIDEAATVYFWHQADNAENIGHMISYFPPKWTPAL